MQAPLRALVDEWTGGELADLGWSLGVIAAALLFALLLGAVARRLFRGWARRTDTPLDDQIIERFERPVGWLLPLLLLRAALPWTNLPDGPSEALQHACVVGLIACAGWFASALVEVAQDLVERRFDLSAEDNLQARAVHTQVRGFRNIAHFTIWLLSLAAALMTFDGVRHFGVSLLASAGIAGIVFGFAAQRSIATVLGGLQIAITQPIRVDDVVIVEGEWGRIEEIRLSYVVVRIWDLRRLVVPITYFIEKPFQNWTRVSADLLGTVFLYTDYTVPVEALRAELGRILEQTELWDRKASGLVVTNATDRSMELRALVSASDAGKLWDLRCLVREQLIAYLQREHPDALPRVRARLEGATELS